MNNDIFDAVFGYYMVTLGAGAFTGVRSTLRSAHGDSAVGASSDGPGVSDIPGDPGSFGERGRRIGERTARKAATIRRSRAASDAADIAGWVSGIRLYRAAQRGAADATERALAKRNGGTGPGEPAGETPANDQRPVSDPAPTAADDTQPAGDPTTASVAGPDTDTKAAADDDLDLIARIVTDPNANPNRNPNPDSRTAPDTAPATGRPVLTLVPPLKEYPEIMPAADITDIESLLGFTSQAAGFAGMESEDALSASASTIAAAEFAGDTARRIEDETSSIEGAIAAMTLLNVDAATRNAYQSLHEAGGVYRDLANRFAAGCQDLAAVAESMSGAASNYHEAAVAARDTVIKEQMPHADAAQATGHGGADGHFYGVASTQGTALSAPATNALPVGN